MNILILENIRTLAHFDFPSVAPRKVPSSAFIVISLLNPLRVWIMYSMRVLHLNEMLKLKLFSEI